ncbi:hypothetical protein D9X30_1807 [Cupriavidus sp. U2]|uniref:oligosaccharide repeat unit polymerase n=1 Tax=Cupriavidus sp. U2 TaxID=2920269 RepID=UPI001892911C|nr:oligosaccharide repeat unit polymerase [Cupriavidus sp. U2]KAI3593258.1 hypothetical protein D9X30_1807 [Cupriavidus sp. U2]
MTMPGARHAYDGYWWDDPARLLLCFILPLYGLVSLELLGDQKSIDHIYFNGTYAMAGALFLLAVAAGALGERVLAPRAADTPVVLSVRVLDALFWLACIGYVVMMGGVIARPAMLLSYLNGGASTYDVLELKGRVVGISTLTQASVAYVPLYFVIFRTAPRGLNRYQVYLGVLFVLTLLRSFIFAERLALVEVVLPWALMMARFRLRPPRGSLRAALLALGPFAAIPPLIGFFIANEYNRSWETYYVNIYDNIFDFALERLGLYYSTAINNGSGLLTIMGWGTGAPTFTFDWLIRFPIVGESFRPLVGADDGYSLFLNTFGDPEFNNPSGIFVHFYEWGGFALLEAALMGWLLGRSYTGWRAGHGFWCCAHAVLLVSLMEILRVPNLFSGRNFVPLALLWLVFRCLGKPAASVSPAGVRSLYGRPNLPAAGPR